MPRLSVESDYIADGCAHGSGGRSARTRRNAELLEELRTSGSLHDCRPVSSAMRHDMRELENELTLQRPRQFRTGRSGLCARPANRMPRWPVQGRGQARGIYALGSLTAVEQIRAAQKRADQGVCVRRTTGQREREVNDPYPQPSLCKNSDTNFD